MSDSLRCLRMRSFFGQIAPDSICSLCKYTVGEHSTGRPAPDPHSAHIAKSLSKVAERVRKKVKSIRDWGWDPSAAEESRARADAHDAANEVTRTVLNEVADALEEEAEELTR